MNIYLILSILICIKVFNLSFQNNYINNIKNNLTKKITPLMITIGYNCVYIYSLCNIKFNIIKNKINTQFILLYSYLKENKILTENIIHILVFIDENGNEINKIMSNKLNIEFNKLECKKLNYSGLFLMDKNVNTKCVNNIFYTSFPSTFDYKVSNISFMSIELEYENKIYPINLKNDKYNYYIINNCLTPNFFKYYIKNVIKAQINTDSFDYKLSIIDNNVNIITLLPNQYILIMEDDYQIHSVSNNADTLKNNVIDKSLRSK